MRKSLTPSDEERRRRTSLIPFCSLLFTFIYFSIAPAGSILGDYRPFFGNLHSHTSYSDGEDLPSDAFYYARYTAGIDFLAVTDHSEQMSPWNPLPPYFRWAKLQKQANAANDEGSFVALAGYEYSHVLAGHLNVFGTDVLIWYPDTFYLQDFYQEILGCPGALVQFNHPYDEDYFHNWFDFFYAGLGIDRRISLIEADGFHEHFEDGYIRALEKGWHVAPVANQDNHGPDWGDKDSRRTGLWVESLTRDNVLDCIRDRRCFSSTDTDGWIFLAGNGKSMGWGTRTTPVDLTVVIHDTIDDTWDRIELIGPGGAILATEYPDSEDFTWEVTEHPTADTYWYAKAYQEDGQLLISTPFWFVNR